MAGFAAALGHQGPGDRPGMALGNSGSGALLSGAGMIVEVNGSAGTIVVIG